MQNGAKGPRLFWAVQSGQGRHGGPVHRFVELGRWCSTSARRAVAAPSPCRRPPQGTRLELESLVIVQNAERLLTPGEVALLFRVDPKTVTRWASAGRIGSIRTPGGHRRFRESEVRDLLTDLTVDLSPSTA